MKFNARKIKYEIVEMKVGFVSQVKMCSSVECEREFSLVFVSDKSRVL